MINIGIISLNKMWGVEMENKNEEIKDIEKEEVKNIENADNDNNDGIKLPISLIVSVIAILVAFISIIRMRTIQNDFYSSMEEMKNSIANLETQIETMEVVASGDSSLAKAKIITDFDDYLKFLRDNTGYIALFSVKDIQGYSMTESQADLLKQLGFDQADTLLEHEYHSFIGIVQDGKMVYQQVGGDEAITYSTNIVGSDISIESSTLNAGNKAIIKVNDIDYALNERAFNIVLIDSESGDIVDSVEFDTHVNEITCQR